MNLHDKLNLLGARAETALNKCRSLINSKLKIVNGEITYIDQPDGGPPHIGAYGASCALIALITTGVDQDDPLVRDLLDFLCNHQLDSGAWTIRNATPVGLTTSCAFALLAFGFCGVKLDRDKETVLKGIEWLIRNSAKDGWPFFEGGSETAVTPTAWSVRAFRNLTCHLPPAGMQALKQGCLRLENTISEKGFVVSRGARGKGSIAATSLALISLVESGYPLYAEPVRRGFDWLTKQNDWLVHDNSDSFYAHLPKNATAHVNYVHFTPALMLQALLACEADLIQEEVVRLLVEHLLATQSEDGQWNSPFTPREAPIWIIMDGVIALKRFIIALASVKGTLYVRSEILRVDREVQEAVKKQREEWEELKSRLSLLEAQIARNSEKVDFLYPTLRFLRLGSPYFVIALLVVGYLFIRPMIPDQNKIDIIALIVSAIFTALAIYDSRRNR
jgi:hypothetical protein